MGADLEATVLGKREREVIIIHADIQETRSRNQPLQGPLKQGTPLGRLLGYPEGGAPPCTATRAGERHDLVGLHPPLKPTAM